ncbi:MAG: hypothetical protein CVU00_06660 [Bacteroidetes bacterium HGW-Bacteroidetes-17]|jgi:hypothetical protein|nr:MAG: hypothetical protein CVU00_06660 [Bacteroidetes bacterium HGW-Bacteroidetes-17]
MKRKNIFLLIMLLIPAFSFAQLKLDLNINTGISFFHLNKAYAVSEYDSKLLLKGGLELNYEFNSNIGLGVGVNYSDTKDAQVLNFDQRFQAISIPVNIHTNFNSIKFGTYIGLALNYKINEDYDYASMSFAKYEYRNYTTSTFAGIYYILSSKIKLGIHFETDIQPFFSYQYMSTDVPVDKIYLRSVSVKLGYTLFGNNL